MPALLKRIFGASVAQHGKARKLKGRSLSTRRFRAPQNLTSKFRGSIGGNVERSAAALPVIRSLSRDLSRNSPYARAAVRTLVNHAIGKGISYSISGDDRYRRDFLAWANSTDCDYEGQQTLHGLISTAAHTLFEAGDVLLVRLHKRTPQGIVLQLQVIDPDQIYEGAAPKYAGNEVIAGVEVAPKRGGRVIGYHIQPDPDRYETEFIPADKAQLLFEKEYAGQVRGIPRGSQALDMAGNAAELMSHALAKAKVEACLAVLLKTPAGETGEFGLFGEDDYNDEDDEFAIPTSISPASIIPLPEGWDAQIVAPAGSGGLKDHLQKSVEAVAVAYGVTYAQASGDATGANYSSSKIALIEFRRGIEVVQTHVFMPALRVIEAAYREVYELTHGRTVTAKIRMIPPAIQSIEPAKEILAEMTELAAGLTTLVELWLARGKDPDEMWAELAEQKARLEALGMPLKFGNLDLSLLLEFAKLEAQEAEAADRHA
jgi:lambda family phage portal protein